ncbi:MAG: hypothetical protein AAGI28_11615 [Pseudomonadota bacterium]
MPIIPDSLPPVVALVIFVTGVVAGYQYRRVWKAEGPRTQLWIYGTIASVCLLMVGLIPLEVPSQ